MHEGKRLNRDFFTRDVLEVAPSLPGKLLCVNDADGITGKYMITEVEAYRGEEDKACHVSRGRTSRNEIMYQRGGFIYMYLIYGMYWMLNIVTAEKEIPQAVLIRGIKGFHGPGKLTRHLNLDGSFYGEDVCESERIWLEDQGIHVEVKQGKRIGIDYAGSYWRDIEWRYYAR
ncbi:MAG: DNA-3-methyladenine glycosylase [Bacteroidota bacterium]